MNKEKRFLVESLGKEPIETPMSDYGWDLQKSMGVPYSSETFAKLKDERFSLYYQGAIYVYSPLKQEIEEGTIDQNQILLHNIDSRYVCMRANRKHSIFIGHYKYQLPSLHNF